ncbi:hypothetical protein H4219_000523 [Mycoemilia scoparia]|uniref:Flavodoxin-like domain-containing protein n=1 Tax=Mycoemilia scoparia TaxID=417184 RepID=A0A9W8A713_9FUNG|nr:hypothetical protein H4219_000523 [Mycoemilia scoparia]
MPRKPLVYVIYYSTFGHLAALGDSLVEGLKANDQVEVKVFQVPEILTEEELRQLQAAPKRSYIPVIKPEQLEEPDGIMMGLPGALAGKMAGIFLSTASQNGGQETTALTFLPVLVHHGIMFVPLGPAIEELKDIDVIHGGSYYGCGTITAGDGSRMPSELENVIARKHGAYFASVVYKHFRNTPKPIVNILPNASVKNEEKPEDHIDDNNNTSQALRESMSPSPRLMRLKSAKQSTATLIMKLKRIFNASKTR